MISVKTIGSIRKTEILVLKLIYYFNESMKSSAKPEAVPNSAHTFY